MEGSEMSKDVHSAGMPGAADRCSDQATGNASELLAAPDAALRRSSPPSGPAAPGAAPAGGAEEVPQADAMTFVLTERVLHALEDIAALAVDLRDAIGSLLPLVEDGHFLLLGARAQIEAIGAMADFALLRCGRPCCVGGDVWSWRVMAEGTRAVLDRQCTGTVAMSLEEHAELLLAIARAASVLKVTIEEAMRPAGKNSGYLIGAVALSVVAIGLRADNMLPELGRQADGCGDTECWLTGLQSSPQDIVRHEQEEAA
jgi:hypothetical protein